MRVDAVRYVDYKEKYTAYLDTLPAFEVLASQLDEQYSLATQRFIASYLSVRPTRTQENPTVWVSEEDLRSHIMTFGTTSPANASNSCLNASLEQSVKNNQASPGKDAKLMKMKQIFWRVKMKIHLNSIVFMIT